MPHRFNDFEEAFNDLHEKSVEEYLKADAERQGIPWSEYCYMHGIVGTAQVRRIKRHEVASYQEMVSESHEEREDE